MECHTARLLERHLTMSKEWFPHEMVPWGEGRDFTPGDTDNSEVDAVHPGVRSALFVNLLTEDNLPHYFHTIARAFDERSAMGEWTRRWAAEEQRHSTVIRDWICVTRRLDLVALERARLRQVSVGFCSEERESTLGDGLVYLTLQELATRISHRNTGQLLGDPAGTAIMSRVAADENLHFLFYRDLATAALEEDPSAVVRAIERQVTNFEMPGAGIEDFARHAAAIAAAGIYDFRVHYEQILVPVILRHWGLESLDGLDGEAEAARERTLRWIARLGRVAERLETVRLETVRAESGDLESSVATR
jgi:acyl-[acyl-carrier-protein] desaturase